MPARCRHCGQDLAVGALRCRWCGADARGAKVEVRATFTLEALLSPDQERALELLSELQALAPSVAIWIRQDPGTRGPRPDVRESDRTRVEELLAELRALRQRMRPKG